MNPFLAILIVFFGLLLCDVIASSVAKRKYRKASEALNQRARIGWP